MHPAKLAAQAADLDRHAEVLATVGPNLRWRSWSAGGVDAVQDLGVELDRVHAPPGTLPVFLARTSATPQAPMVRRTAIDAIGGFHEAFRDMYEDQVFLARLLLAGPVYVSSAVLQRYRQHDASCVHLARLGGRHLAARARFLAWLSGHLASAPVSPVVSARVAQSVRRERLRLWWHRVRGWTRLRR
jgi:GT2 family glycosyltransferase